MGEDLIKDFVNAEGKMECTRCNSVFVVYFKEDSEVQFCPGCGVVASNEHIKYIEG